MIQIILLLIVALAFVSIIFLYYQKSQSNQKGVEGMAPVLKECQKDPYPENDERDIYQRWPYIEYEPDCKWRRFDSIRY